MVLLAPLLIFCVLNLVLIIDFYFWRKRDKAKQGLGWTDWTQSHELGASQPPAEQRVVTQGFERIMENQFRKHEMN